MAQSKVDWKTHTSESAKRLKCRSRPCAALTTWGRPTAQQQDAVNDANVDADVHAYPHVSRRVRV
eukprot:8833218-Lingulodinium_polyedra.AAC.1